MMMDLCVRIKLDVRGRPFDFSGGGGGGGAE